MPPIFRIIEKEGSVNEIEMFTTFNMGIGMMLFVDKTGADTALNVLKKTGYNANLIGETKADKDEKVKII